MSSTIFTELISLYTTWPALSSFLKSESGGNLRIDDNSTADSPYAIIRYVKGKSDLSKPHVRAFRSIVWDTLENRPVSVTPFKSHDGECLPQTGSPQDSEYVVESFLDGVLIGMWFDKYNNTWRIHTRSTIDGNCRYYSQNTTFAEMFWSTLPTEYDSMLDRDACYSWILQHPDNRIVVPVRHPNSTCVQKCYIDNQSNLTWETQNSLVRLTGLTNWLDVQRHVLVLESRFTYNVQGIHISGPGGQRWKIRTDSYNRVRALRGNTPRRDFIWLREWQNHSLPAYLAVFPEERTVALREIERWKQITSDVYHTYVDVFKARSLPAIAIPQKLRTFVYGLHNKYISELKPQNKSVDWKATLEYMNSRDVALMLFTLNYEVRNASRQLGISRIPIEPPTISTSIVLDPSNIVECTTAV